MTQWRGEEIIEVARPHLGEPYVLGARAQLSNPSHRGPWDCAEFTSWCAYQAYGIVFGAYGNSPRTADPYSGKWYEDGRDADALIAPQEALQIPGVIVGRRPQTMGHRVGHVAISLGGGQTIEARGQRYGVVIVNSASRPWNFGVMIPGVEYLSGGTGSTISTENARILRVQSPFIRGAEVRCVQEALASRGIDPGAIDGIYGQDTEAAVYNFQAMEGLTVDGEVGEETAQELGLAWPIDPNCSGGGTGSTAVGPSTYTVVAGDSLSRIAQRFGCSLDAILDANPQITNPNVIHVGQTIQIPCATAGESSGGTGSVAGFSNAEVEVLAKTIYGEARGEPQVGQEAVGFVVMNRVRQRSWWGSDIIGVCKYPWQFSCWNRNDPNAALLNSMSAGDQRLLPCLDSARRVLTNRTQNPIGDATHYYADYIAEPAWVTGATYVTQIGRHRFYANVA